MVGDRDELIQLFQNLIHNAIKYGREGGHVWISSAMPPRTARSSSRSKDDGEGIPASAVPRLTERFYRVDVKRSRERGGTGLGLAIVKHIVSRHQGRLTIESKLGEGSTFTVFLPVAPARNRAQKPAPRACHGSVIELSHRSWRNAPIPSGTRDGTPSAMTDHTVKAFTEQLEALSALVAQMGGLAEAQLADAIEAIARRDTGRPKARWAAMPASTPCSRRSRTGR